MKAKEASELRYVGFFDILGMSDLILQNHAKAWEVLGRLRHEFDESLKVESRVTAEGDGSSSKFKVGEQLRYFTFSDSVLVFTSGDTTKDLLSIVGFCSEFLAVTFGYCVPLRGAVVHGEFWFNFDHNVFSGPALVMAYRAADDPQWMGLTVDHVVAKRLQECLSKTSQVSPVCKWDIGIKSSSAPASINAFNWPALHKDAFQLPGPISGEQLYAGGFDKIFGPFEKLDPRAQAKYANTAAFINAKLF